MITILYVMIAIIVFVIFCIAIGKGMKSGVLDSNKTGDYIFISIFCSLLWIVVLPIMAVLYLGEEIVNYAKK